jgi:hypothetical protein
MLSVRPFGCCSDDKLCCAALLHLSLMYLARWLLVPLLHHAKHASGFNMHGVLLLLLKLNPRLSTLHAQGTLD